MKQAGAKPPAVADSAAFPAVSIFHTFFTNTRNTLYYKPWTALAGQKALRYPID